MVDTARVRFRQLLPARDREAPLVLDLCLVGLPVAAAAALAPSALDPEPRAAAAAATHVRLEAAFTKAFLRVSEQQPDANRGIDVPAAIVTYDDPSAHHCNSRRGGSSASFTPSDGGCGGGDGGGEGAASTRGLDWGLSWQAWGIAAASVEPGASGPRGSSGSPAAAEALPTPLLHLLSTAGPQQASPGPRHPTVHVACCFSSSPDLGPALQMVYAR